MEKIVVILLIAVAAFVGGIVVALLGWTETKEPFNARKFASSIIRSLIAAVVFAVAYNYSEVTPLSYLIAFLGGAGVDAGLQRAGAAIANRNQ